MKRNALGSVPSSTDDDEMGPRRDGRHHYTPAEAASSSPEHDRFIEEARALHSSLGLGGNLEDTEAYTAYHEIAPSLISFALKKEDASAIDLITELQRLDDRNELHHGYYCPCFVCSRMFRYQHDRRTLKVPRWYKFHLFPYDFNEAPRAEEISGTFRIGELIASIIEFIPFDMRTLCNLMLVSKAWNYYTNNAPHWPFMLPMRGESTESVANSSDVSMHWLQEHAVGHGPAALELRYHPTRIFFNHSKPSTLDQDWKGQPKDEQGQSVSFCDLHAALIQGHEDAFTSSSQEFYIAVTRDDEQKILPVFSESADMLRPAPLDPLADDDRELPFAAMPSPDDGSPTEGDQPATAELPLVTEKVEVQLLDYVPFGRRRVRSNDERLSMDWRDEHFYFHRSAFAADIREELSKADRDGWFAPLISFIINGGAVAITAFMILLPYLIFFPLMVLSVGSMLAEAVYRRFGGVNFTRVPDPSYRLTRLRRARNTAVSLIVLLPYALFYVFVAITVISRESYGSVSTWTRSVCSDLQENRTNGWFKLEPGDRISQIRQPRFSNESCSDVSGQSVGLWRIDPVDAECRGLHVLDLCFRPVSGLSPSLQPRDVLWEHSSFRNIFVEVLDPDSGTAPCTETFACRASVTRPFSLLSSSSRLHLRESSDGVKISEHSFSAEYLLRHDTYNGHSMTVSGFMPSPSSADYLASPFVPETSSVLPITFASVEGIRNYYTALFTPGFARNLAFVTALLLGLCGALIVMMKRITTWKSTPDPSILFPDRVRLSHDGLLAMTSMLTLAVVFLILAMRSSSLPSHFVPPWYPDTWSNYFGIGLSGFMVAVHGVILFMQNPLVHWGFL